METADGPAIAATSGLVGHSGKFGCRLYCELPGRRRHEDSHYYPALLKPLDYHEEGCLHPDVTPDDLIRFNSNTAQRYHDNLKLLLKARNPTQYNKQRVDTSIVKQTILLGLPSRPDVPNLFVLDAMHWSAINKPDEFFALWRATINVYPPDSRDSWDWAVLEGKKWDRHGKTVDLSRKFIPPPWGTPRDPTKKLQTKYKAIKKLMYLYGLAPPLLHNILPKRYWLHFCKYITGSKLLLGWKVAPEDLIKGNWLMLEALFEFEELYIQPHPEQIHFARQSTHIDDHVTKEIVCYSPPACYSQWTTENAIENLEREQNQHQNPFMNIAQQAVPRVQVNTITALYPEKLPSQTQDAQLPRGSEEVGNGYALLRPLDSTS
ncbi:hypothetical protein V5O48_017319 [Marasmius crinis-equi]|uniref:Uncharacterized protein n=1 Tax=Marasmius crinis-equi TaxID=585013 RepID=A0ABR3EPA8_9AGAR